MAEIPPYSLDDIVDLNMPEDDFLASEFGLGNSLPELHPADVLGLHANAIKDATAEGLLTTEGCNEEVDNAIQDEDLHLDVQEAIEALLHLSSDRPVQTLILQSQGDTMTTEPLPSLATLETSTTTGCTTSEMTLGDDSKTVNGIDLMLEEDDDDNNHNDSGQWSTEVHPPDDAVWCMSNVPGWEAGFSAWCSTHQGQSFHCMLPHCVIQCVTCLATLQLTPDGFWYSPN